MTIFHFLSAASLLTALSTWIAYFARVPSGTVPDRPLGSMLMQAVSLGTGIAALALAMCSSTLTPLDLLAATPGLIGITLAAVFFWLYTQRKTPVGALAVAVGDMLPNFASTTSTGASFQADDLRGERILLKFFRGSW